MQKKLSKKKLNEDVLKLTSSHKLNGKSLKLKELRELNESLQNLNEATFGERFKYLAAKYLPSYKVGNKILGGSKERARLQAEIQKLIDAEAEQFLKKLNDDIGKEFPNNLEQEDFLKGVLKISAVYDSIKAATERPNNPLTPDQANKYIDNLRKYVNFMSGAKLNRTPYSTWNENYNPSENIELGEATMADIQGDLNPDSLKKALGRDRVARGGMEGEDEFESDVMNGLKSNRLPLTLALGGAILAAAGWIGQCEWFIDYIKSLKDVGEEFGQDTKDVIERNIKIDRRGFSYTLQNNLGGALKGLNLNFNQPIENLRKALEFYGNGNLEDGVKITSNFIDPTQRAASVTNLLDQLKDPTNTTVGDVFNPEEKTYGSSGTLFSQTNGAAAVFAQFIVRRIIKKAIWSALKSVGAAVGTALIGAGPWLLAAGIALITTGAVVKAMRIKGQNSSRAATLNSLLQSLRDINNPDPVVGKATSGGGTKTDEIQPQGDKKQLGAGQTPETQKQLGGRPRPKELGAGQTPETQKQLGGRPRPKELAANRSFSDKLDATDVEAQPVNKTQAQTEPEKQKQLPGGETADVDTLKSNLGNFFKNVLTIKPKKRETIKEAKEFDKLNIYKEDNVKQKQIEDFQKSAELLNLLAKNINLALRNPKISSDSKLENLLRKLQQNIHHRTIVEIKTLIKENIKNKDLILRFITTYLTAIKQTRFGKILNYVQPDEQKKPVQLNEEAPSIGLRGEKNIQKFLINFDTQFRIYLTDLYKLLVYLNNPAAKPKAAKPPKNMPDQQYANIGQLEEAKKKKKPKYSEKASEFIGKEISHLKKDKKFPQDKSVAAAINVAKKKGMKVGPKKK